MRPFEFYWPPQDIQAIAITQTLTQPGVVTLKYPIFMYDKIARSVSITGSGNPDPGNTINIIFTIQGTYNGKPRTATITNILNNTNDTSTGVYSSDWEYPPQLSPTDIIFDTVTSVTASGDIGDFPITFSVGTGLYGRTSWVNFDYFESGITNSAQVVFQDGNIEYSLGVTLQDVTKVSDNNLLLLDPTSSGGDPDNGFMNHQTTPTLGYWSYPYCYGAIFITQSSDPPDQPGTDATGNLYGIIINSGNGRR